jgi:cholest-4-en-3-one 26-monooxygenase
MTAVDAPTIDLLAETWGRGVPHDQLAWLRNNEPVHWHPEPYGGRGFWAVTKHADVQAISRNTELFSSWHGGTFIVDHEEEALEKIRMSILNMDPPLHSRYRRLVSKGFTPKVVRTLQDKAERRATAIVDEVIERGEVEFVEDVAALLPLQMIADMIGIPDSEHKQLFEWSNRMVGFDDPELQTSPEDGEMAAMEIFAYCDEIAADRRANPRDDLMSILANAEVDGETMSDMELDLFFVTLVVAGNETSRNLITHSTLALIENPDQAELLRRDPSVWPTAIDEMLRWGSSIHNFRRDAMADTEIRGQAIAEGDKVVMYYMSANWDEDVFEDPHSFDLTRTPNDHVTFGGGGEHFCLGHNLAKMQITAMVNEIVTRMPDLETTEEPRRMRSDFINGITRAPMRFTPGTPTG